MSSRLWTFLIIGLVLIGGFFAFSLNNDDAVAVDENGRPLVVLNRGNSAEPSSLDPHRSSGTWENNIIGDMFIGLYTEDSHANAVFGAASSHEVSDDGLVHTFTIREDMVWSDGVPVTANDFVFSIRRILDPAMAAEYAAILYIIENAQAVNFGQLPKEEVGVRAIDDHTLEIRLERPAPYLPQLLTHYTAFAVPQHVVEQYGDQWTRPENIVTNGPYVLREWLPNSHIILEKSPTFYDADNVAIDRVVFYPTTDSTAALRRFLAGELDINSDFPSQQYTWLQEHHPEETRVFEYITTSYIAVNTQVEPFNNPRLRYALAMAIDRDLLAYQVLRTGQIPAYSLVPINMPNYTPAQADFAEMSQEDRVRAAQEIMRELGYSPENPLQFTYRYRESTDNRRAAVAVARFWGEIYVDVNLVNTEVAVHYDDLRSGNFQIGDAGWVADYADAENYLFLVDSESGQLNYGKYNNPAYDALLDQAAHTLDLEARAEILHQAEAILMREMPLIPTTYGVSRSLVGEHVVGWDDNLLNIHRTRFMSIDESQRPVRVGFMDRITNLFN